MITNILTQSQSSKENILLFFFLGAYLTLLPFILISYNNDRYGISENNKLYIFRPSDYCFLKKIKVLDKDKCFNYFFLIPLFIGFALFLFETIFLILYLFRVSFAVKLIHSYLFLLIVSGYIFVDGIYHVIIGAIRDRTEICVFDKEQQEIQRAKIAEKRKKDELKYLAKLEKKARRQKDKNKH